MYVLQVSISDASRMHFPKLNLNLVYSYLNRSEGPALSRPAALRSLGRSSLGRSPLARLPFAGPLPAGPLSALIA